MAESMTKGPAETVDELAALLQLHHGVRLDYAGDDGAIVMLGHRSDRRTVAACNALARRVAGMCNLTDDRRSRYQDVAPFLSRTWAVLMQDCGAIEDHEDGVTCSTCAEFQASTWWVRWHVGADLPGAFPVTVWSP